MWSQSRNYWKDNKDVPEADEGEAEHAHCDGCYKIKCQYKSKKSCSLMQCPLSCGAAFHSCKANEHKELCSKEIVPCVNSFYGCKQSMRRSERGHHLATCPASVVYCTMEWNRWPVFSRERQERVPFTQKNLHARYGQLDVALAMRDQRILYEAMKAPRRVRRSLRNRLTERFPAVPLTSSHSSYVEGTSVDTAGVTSDEDAGGDAPWDLSRDPPGLQRSICKELFKTDSGSLHLDALDAQVQERNGSENADRSAIESNLCTNSSRTNSCSSFDQKDIVSTSVKHLQGCDMVGLPVSEGHLCSSCTVPVVAGDVSASNAGEFALVDRPAILPELSHKASEECCAVDQFHSEGSVFVSTLTVKTIGENERVSDMEEDVKLGISLGDEISRDSGPVTSCVNTGASEQLSKLLIDPTTFDVDLTISDSSHLLDNFSTNTVGSKTNAAIGATSFQQDVLLNPCLTDKTTSLEESSSLSIENSCSAVAVSDKALVNSDRLTDAGKAPGGIESAHRSLNECQGMSTDAAESLEFFPELVFLGIDVASVTSLYHHNAVVFLPPAGGTIANPGTVVVDLPKEYHNLVKSSSVPPPTIPPPLTLQEILALDLNLESITRYQAKPRSMYTFLCAQNFRRDEYPWHFKNVHSEIHGGLSGWIEARCPLACYGCTYSTRRLNPVNGTVLYNSEVDCFGVRPNSSHCKSLGELSQAPTRAHKEATPEIYTSKDYESAVNIKCRSYAKENMALVGEPFSQEGFTGVIDVVAQTKGTGTDGHKPNEDPDVFHPRDDLSKFDTEVKGTVADDVFPSYSNLSSDTMPSTSRESYSSTKDIPGGSLDWDNMTISSEGSVVKGLDESLLLRMLPFEVLQHIAHRLDSFSLCNLAMTSHFLREVCRSIVEHRGIVVQEWEKKQFDSGSSWQVTYQRWLFSSAFTPCKEWHFEDSPNISEHLKVCPFNVMAEPRTQPVQLCCLSMSEDDYRNHEAEKKLQKMYPGFDPKSIQCPDNCSRMPGAEVLDHLYVNEIGKSGFSGYKRALKSFAQLCSEQFRDNPDQKPGVETLNQFGESLEPRMALEASEHFGDYLEPKLETSTSEQFEDYLEPELATKSSEHFGDGPEPHLEVKTSELFEEYLEPKLETLSSGKFGESLELETKSSEQFEAYLEPKLETNTLELLEDSLEPKLETIISEQFGETMTAEKVGGSIEPKLETFTSEQFEDFLETKLEAKASEQMGNFMEQNLEPNT